MPRNALGLGGVVVAVGGCVGLKWVSEAGSVECSSGGISSALAKGAGLLGKSRHGVVTVEKLSSNIGQPKTPSR